jgi:hypothetical protein
MITGKKRTSKIEIRTLEVDALAGIKASARQIVRDGGAE